MKRIVIVILISFIFLFLGGCTQTYTFQSVLEEHQISMDEKDYKIESKFNFQHETQAIDKKEIVTVMNSQNQILKENYQDNTLQDAKFCYQEDSGWIMLHQQEPNWIKSQIANPDTGNTIKIIDFVLSFYNNDAIIKNNVASSSFNFVDYRNKLNQLNPDLVTIFIEYVNQDLSNHMIKTQIKYNPKYECFSEFKIIFSSKQNPIKDISVFEMVVTISFSDVDIYDIDENKIVDADDFGFNPEVVFLIGQQINGVLSSSEDYDTMYLDVMESGHYDFFITISNYHVGIYFRDHELNGVLSASHIFANEDHVLGTYLSAGRYRIEIYCWDAEVNLGREEYKIKVQRSSFG